MLFVKSEDLKIGMRLAKPIYNRSGVLLYERDTKLSDQGIRSVQNFGLIGLYVLEPAEPVPPMTPEDIEFEKFQTIGLFSLKDEMNLILDGKRERNVAALANTIVKKYGFRDQRINFIQNLRSKEDYIYKHSLNVAILAAIIAQHMRIPQKDKTDLVLAALYHDIGKLTLSAGLMKKVENLSKTQQEHIRKAERDGITLIGRSGDVLKGSIPIILKYYKEKYNDNYKISDVDREKYMMSLILRVATDFDELTAMNIESGPASEVQALKMMIDRPEIYDETVLGALIKGINILTPGVCVELSNGEKGIVLVENKDEVLKPMILYFRTNNILNLNQDDIAKEIQIKDIMKTMDNRHIIDKETLDKYKTEYN